MPRTSSPGTTSSPRARSRSTASGCARFALGGRARPLVPSVVGLAARRPGPGLAGRRRAVGRPPGPGRTRVGRGRRSTPTPTRWSSIRTSTTRRSGSSTGCGSRRSCIPPPTTSPRSACRSSRGVRRGRRAGVPDGGRAGAGPGPFPVATHHQLLLGLGVDDPGGALHGRSGPHRRPGPVRRPVPVPALPGPGRPAQGHLRCWPLFAAYKERHPGSPPPGLAGPVVEAPGRPPRHRRARSGLRGAQKWALLGGAAGPGVARPLGGVLAGDRRGVERRHPGGGQRRLRGHRRALPALGRRPHLRRLRRVRGGGRPADRRRRTCGRPSAAGAGPTSTAGSGGRGSSTATPPSWSRWLLAAGGAVSGRRAARQIPVPSGRGAGCGHHPDAEDGGAGQDPPDPVATDGLGRSAPAWRRPGR